LKDQDRARVLRESPGSLQRFHDGPVLDALKHAPDHIGRIGQRGFHLDGNEIIVILKKHIQTIARGQWVFRLSRPY
jgi:hypothetical protein